MKIFFAMDDSVRRRFNNFGWYEFSLSISTSKSSISRPVSDSTSTMGVCYMTHRPFAHTTYALAELYLSYIHLIIVMWKFSYSVNFSTWGFSVLFLPLSTSYNGHSFPLRLSEGVSLSARMWINQNQCETIMS